MGTLIHCWQECTVVHLLQKTVWQLLRMLIQSYHMHECVCTQLLQAGLTVCNPADHRPPGSSAHGILQARIPEWVAMPSSRGSSRPRDQSCISYIPCIGRHVLYPLAPPEKSTQVYIFIKFLLVMISNWRQEKGSRCGLCVGIVLQNTVMMPSSWKKGNYSHTSSITSQCFS